MGNPEGQYRIRIPALRPALSAVRTAIKRAGPGLAMAASSARLKAIRCSMVMVVA